MHFNEWFSIVERSVKVVAPHEIVESEDPVRMESGMLFKTPLFVAALAESLKKGARYAYESDVPDDFLSFSRAVASQFCIGNVFRSAEEPSAAHWSKPDQVEDDWKRCCVRYDKLLARTGYSPILMAADIEQMVIYEKGPFAHRNTWVGKLLSAAILKQNGFAPPLIESKVLHDEAIRSFKSWVTYYEKLVKPVQGRV